ncbi:MAG: protein TolR [Gammaproteobacteria bacterium]|nr:protein TolR [Gammaproteobacteria bacterium]|tara:strand:+ start:91 stop:519 length:429 start_codon:yes stop_codon:yes gene_type:complete
MRYRDKKKLLAEINVVPYIDVMLVLLLVFMITTPLLYQGLDVDLPTTEANEIDTSKFEEPLIVEVNSKGIIRIIQEESFNEQVSEQDLADTIISIYKSKKIDKVYVKGDKKIEYEKIIRIISILNKGGVENIGLITLPVNEK